MGAAFDRNVSESSCFRNTFSRDAGLTAIYWESSAPIGVYTSFELAELSLLPRLVMGNTSRKMTATFQNVANAKSVRLKFKFFAPCNREKLPTGRDFRVKIRS